MSLPAPDTGHIGEGARAEARGPSLPHRAPIGELLAELEGACAEMPAAQVPAVLGDLERTKAALWSRLLHALPTAPTSSPGPEPLLTITDVAHRLQIPKSKAYELARQPGFPVLHLGKHLRVNGTALNVWLEQQHGRPLDRSRAPHHTAGLDRRPHVTGRLGVPASRRAR